MAMLFSSTKEKRGGKKMRPRKGAVAFMAVLVVVVMAILFQAYMTHVMNDMKTGQRFDTQAQYNGERMAIGNLVKEAVLQYYERPRVGQPGSTIRTILNSYLVAMTNGGTVTYLVTDDDATITGIFPTNNASLFWPTLIDSNGDGFVMNAGDSTPITGAAFRLNAVALPATGLEKSRLGQYVGDANGVVFSVVNGAGANVLPITILRREAGTLVATYRYYVRLYQVPITDFSAVAYAISDNVGDIPAAPPSLAASPAIQAAIQNHAISGLALSQMDVNNDINQATGTAGTNYPYLYRELFSSCASLWEYVLYNNTANISYMSSLIPNRLGVYILSDPYSGTVFQTQSAAAGAAPVQVANQDGSTGFDPDYMVTIGGVLYHVNLSGYWVNSNGEYLNPAGNVTTTTLVTLNDNDLNGDGIPDDAKQWAAPTSVNWTIDLNNIPNTAVGNANFRTIYIHLPDDLTVEPIPTSSMTITDSAAGVTANRNAPVIICIEGWSRANALMANPAAAIPPDYLVNIEGGGAGGANMLGQQVFIYAVGANIHINNTTQMNGMIVLDDRIGQFSSVSPFTLNGLLAWNGDSAAVNLANVTLARPVAKNAFRAIAPRFLLVDVRSETN